MPVDGDGFPIDRWGFPRRDLGPIRPPSIEPSRRTLHRQTVLDGLRALCAQPPRIYSYIEIAKACNCTEAHIRNVERRAMRKLRFRLEAIDIKANEHI